MAAHLHAAQVPVQLLVIFDGTSGPPPAPNVRKLVNLYVSGGWGGPIARPKGFRGTLQNIRFPPAWAALSGELWW
jgi:hypothetical protein